MKYTIIIVTFNRLEKLKKCIHCAEKQLYRPNYIVIVDNASTDGTHEYLGSEKFNNQRFNIIRMSENTGGSGGFHTGVKEALNLNDDWILLIDDDAMLREDYVKEIFNNMTSNIKAYSGCVNEFGNISLEHRRLVKFKPLYKECLIPGDYVSREFFDYDLASFCGLMIRSDLVREIGLPRGDFFLWYDDTEYSLRIRKHSSIRNINKAVLDHEIIPYKSEIRKSHKMNWKVYYGLRNRLYTLKMHSSILSVIFEILFLALRYAKYSLWAFSMNLDKKEIGKNNKIIIKSGIVDGITKSLGKNNKFLP